MPVQQKKGGPYTKQEQEKRREQVYELHFEKGFSTIKPESFNQLAKIANRILKDQTIIAISIEGHTDNTAISGSLKEDYPTNWDLSAKRAVNVVKFLIIKKAVEHGAVIDVVKDRTIEALWEKVPQTHEIEQPLMEFGIYEDGILYDNKQNKSFYFKVVYAFLIEM